LVESYICFKAEIFVTVIDSNEKRPEFSEGVTYELEVSENAPIGFTVIRLNVTDEDERQKVFFNFQTSQYVGSINKFRIDPTTGKKRLIESNVFIKLKKCFNNF
jgi:hypothetical protein